MNKNLEENKTRHQESHPSGVVQETTPAAMNWDNTCQALSTREACLTQGLHGLHHEVTIKGEFQNSRLLGGNR